MPSEPSKGERAFIEAWQRYGLPDSMPIHDTITIPGTRFRLDFAWPRVRVAVEVQGFGFGHSAIKGMERDARKMRAALRAGWIVIPITTACLNSRPKQEAACEEIIDILAALGDRSTAA